MAAPAFESKTAGSTTTAGTSHSISYPASISSGDLLLLVIGTGGGGSGVTFTVTGFTQRAISTYFNRGIHVFYKIAAGTESGTLNFTSTASIYTVSGLYRFSGNDTTSSVIRVTTDPNNTGGDGTVDPPSASHPLSGREYSAVCSGRCSSTPVGTFVVFPTGYTNTNTPISGGEGAFAHSYKTSVSQTEDPSNYSNSYATSYWNSLTVVIASAPSGWSAGSSYGGVSSANISTVDSVATANISSINSV